MTEAGNRGRAAELLKELVSIESVNLDMAGGAGGERRFSDFLAERGRKMGLGASQAEVLPGRPNVLIELRRPGATGTLMFDIHLDTVPLGGERAGSRPQIEGDRLYGRGACDTKGSWAAALMALEALTEKPPDPPCNVILVGTVDEEYLKRGVEALVEGGFRADAAIVGEPTDLRVVIAHKGCVRWELVTHGRAAHTSRPDQGVNAIYQMMRAVETLRSRFEGGRQGVKHSLCGDPTLVVSVIRGGTQANIVPDECRAIVDYRNVPNEDTDEVMREVKTELERLGRRESWIVWECLEPFLVENGLDTPVESPIVLKVQAACRKLGLDPRPAGVPYGTDATTLARVGIPSVVLGPGHIEQAHSPEEWVEISRVATCARLYEEAVRAFAAA